MVKINTDLGVNVQLENAATPVDVPVGSGAQIVGKDKFGQLADTLAKINPKIQKLAQQNIERENLKEANLGAAKINGMTLEESRDAAKKGFPNIYNGWARYGAYKQYALNSVDGMVADWKDEYISKRNVAGYNWQEHYNEFSQGYLSDKEGDEFFASAYNDATGNLRKWINVKEFEKQEEDLKYTVIGNTSKSIQSIPDQVSTALEVAFYEEELQEFGEMGTMNTTDYQKRKAKYFQDNMSDTFLELYNTVKENRNPALTRAEFDDIVINEAELHASLDGRFATEYIELLTQGRPDGTPAIINNPKYQKRVTSLIENLKDAIKLNVDSVNWTNGNVGSMSKTDRTELGKNIFDKEYRVRKNSGASDADAFLGSTLSLMNGIKRNEPIKQIADLFEKPISREYTEDSKLALEVYAALEKNGVTGIYFKENDKNKFKFFVANVLMQAPNSDPRDVIRQIGTMDTQTKEILSLSSNDKKQIRNSVGGNMAYAPNTELVDMVGQYFKNMNNEANDNFIAHTKKFIQEHYEDVNGRWVSKYKINQFGVTKDTYDSFKIAAIELLKEKLNTEKTIIEESDIIGFEFDETNMNPDFNISVTSGIDINKYELIVNDKDDTVYFKIDDGTPLDVPATVEYKSGQTVWLEIPIDIVRDRYNLNADKETARLDKIRAAKDEKVRLRDKANEKFLRETEGMNP